ncbi:hypothetical protein GF373_01320, partial [bacterium]|nr:hypothetical protein [bacterium]
MDGLTIIPRVPILLILLMYATLLAFLFWGYRNAGQYVWGGIYYFANRILVITLLLLLFLHPSWQSRESISEKKVLALLLDSSRSMAIKDEKASQTRAELVNNMLQKTDVLKLLANRYHLRGYRFDSEVTPIAQPSLPDRSEAHGALSRIRHALHAVSSQIAPEILAGIVLISDGVETGAVPMDFPARVPIHAIGVGETET